jgi:mRNA interferase RelE/StbE
LKVVYSSTFAKDLQDVRDPSARRMLEKLIVQMKEAQSLADLSNVKKLRGAPNAFRLRVGDFRLGLFLTGDTLTLHRFLDRKDMYRSFP